MNQFIDKIKCKMIEEHITKKKLSDMIGCSETSLNKWLNEEEEIPVIISNNIIKVLNIQKNKKTISLNTLNRRFNQLSDENKNNVLEYIEFLQYNENKLKLSKKTNNC